jgi:hypothetical protein
VFAEARDGMTMRWTGSFDKLEAVIADPGHSWLKRAALGMVQGRLLRPRRRSAAINV